MFTRYALYFTPPPGPFAEAGAAWLAQDIAARPRRYGFHATLKAPFRLAAGTTEADLRDALHRFCAATAPVEIPALTVAAMGRALALMPASQSKSLETLAAQIVETFDPFRAPLTQAELTKRRRHTLSPAAEARLFRWGYPHVMEAFRFHMTLTGPLPAETRAQTTDAARAWFTPCLPQPMPIDALTLSAEDAGGQFHTLARVPFSAH